MFGPVPILTKRRGNTLAATFLKGLILWLLNTALYSYSR